MSIYKLTVLKLIVENSGKVVVGVVIGAWSELVRYLTGDNFSLLKVLILNCETNELILGGDFQSWFWLFFVFVSSILMAVAVMRLFLNIEVNHGLPYALGLVWGMFGVFSYSVTVKQF